MAALLTGVGLAGFNWLVDPYRIFGSPKIAGLNDIKTKLADHERVFKTTNLLKQNPEVAFLGTSRTDIGLSPLHEIFAGKKTINLAVSSQPYEESEMLFSHLDPKNSRRVIFGMDFFVANMLWTVPSDFLPVNYLEKRKRELLLSIWTFKDSLKTAFHMGQVPGNNWTNEGQRLWNHGYVLSAKGNHQLFIGSEKGYLSMYIPAPNCAFEFDTRNGSLSHMDAARAIFARAYRENTDLRLFISPSHARQWETLAAAGLWDKWEEWKRRLTKMNEEEAKKAGKSPFPIWDFSGYNSISTEAVPPLGDMKNFMRNYFDSSHYTPAVGNLVLDRMFDYHAPDRKVPDDFGTLITSANLDAHLAHIRADREQYRRTHPDDIAEIAALAKKVAHDKHCVAGKL